LALCPQAGKRRLQVAHLGAPLAKDCTAVISPPTCSGLSQVPSHRELVVDRRFENPKLFKNAVDLSDVCQSMIRAFVLEVRVSLGRVAVLVLQYVDHLGTPGPKSTGTSSHISSEVVVVGFVRISEHETLRLFVAPFLPVQGGGLSFGRVA
jgi:hypothetical protein